MTRAEAEAVMAYTDAVAAGVVRTGRWLDGRWDNTPVNEAADRAREALLSLTTERL